MTEQRCIICGNVVEFDIGERFARCEYCETVQELNGAFAEKAPKEPIIREVHTLERARKFDINEIRRKTVHSAVLEDKPFVGSSVSENTDNLFKDIDDYDEENDLADEERGVLNSAAKVVCVMVAIIIILGFVALATGQM